MENKFHPAQIKDICQKMAEFGHTVTEALPHSVITSGADILHARRLVGAIARRHNATYRSVKWCDGGYWYRFSPKPPRVMTEDELASLLYGADKN